MVAPRMALTAGTAGLGEVPQALPGWGADDETGWFGLSLLAGLRAGDHLQSLRCQKAVHRHLQRRRHRSKTCRRTTEEDREIWLGGSRRQRPGESGTPQRCGRTGPGARGLRHNTARCTRRGFNLHLCPFPADFRQDPEAAPLTRGAALSKGKGFRLLPELLVSAGRSMEASAAAV